MKITELISGPETAFTFEVLPPVKGNGIDDLRNTIDRLREFDPKYINITHHRSEYVYREVEGGLMQRQRIRRRPGTVAIAAMLQREYGLPLVPHLLCSGSSRETIEYALIDMQILGISNLLLLRGDKAKEDPYFRPTEDGHRHTTELQEQVNRFNAGFFDDGSPIKHPGEPFSYGVACYPEKHEEAPNLEDDIRIFKRKVELGADYGVTQLFYDNSKYIAFVERCRELGIEVPIIPGIKPLSKLSQITVVPRTFRCDLPELLAHELAKCTTDAEVKQVGIEWAVEQCRELIRYGVPSLHFYTVSAVDSIAQIAKEIY
ncbi:MAG: methylenetetrahydrofolate reductase [NAD(P)H] [Bacteroidales bacterium]|nr:methylenetetrahydrofolate reductase [NAD(P)H] [Bacteroidales bacterium]